MPKGKKVADRESVRALDLSMTEGVRQTTVLTNEHISYPDRKGRRVGHAEEAARALLPHLRARILDLPIRY